MHERNELKERCSELEDELKKAKRCMNGNFDSKKMLTNHHESNRSASDISNNGNNHSANSDSGRWSTDSDEGVLVSNSTSKTANQPDSTEANDLIKKKAPPDTKKPLYFKLNLMNSLKKEANKFKSATNTKSKSDQNLVADGPEKSIGPAANKNEENVRNEDIFIYMPSAMTIREKNANGNQTANKARIFEPQPAGRTGKSFLSRFNSMNCGGLELTEKHAQGRELNKSQSNISSNSSTSSQKSNKPQIVNVYPKRSNSIGELLSDQSKHSDEDEEIKKLYCTRKQIGAKQSTVSDEPKLGNSYKANLQNSIDTLSTNNSLSEDNNEDYEELIAASLQQKRIKMGNQTIWMNEEDEMPNCNQLANLRGNKLYASFANGQLVGDKLKASSDYNSQSLFRTGQYYSEATQKTNKSTSNLSHQSNRSNGSDSQNALINGEFYLRKSRQASVSSLTNGKFESLPIEPSIYGKHLNTLSKERFKNAPQSELDTLQGKCHSATLQHKKERNSTGKKIASQLQSYFFSGSISSKKKTEAKSVADSPPKNGTSNVKKTINDLNEKFPLPNAYKKNFILKGHLNVGLYSNKEQRVESGNLNADPLNFKEEDESIRHVRPSAEHSNGPSIQELKTKSSKQLKNKKIDKSSIELVQSSCVNLGLSSLVSSHGLSSSVSDVHREIALAAKELGAWY